MGALIIAGFDQDWCEFAAHRLSEMGIDPVCTKTSLGVTPDEFLRKAGQPIVDNSLSDSGTSAKLGRAWELAAASIMIANAESEYWSWADPRHINLLEFWADFEPESNFLLLYGSLAETSASQNADSEMDHRSMDKLTDDWTAYHHAVLRFFFANPDRCLLVHIDHFNGRGQKVVNCLTDRFGVPDRRLNASKFREKSSLAQIILEANSNLPPEHSDLLSEFESAADLRCADLDDERSLRIMRAKEELTELRAAVSRVASLEVEIDSLNTQIREHSLERDQLESAIEYHRSQNIEHSQKRLELEAVAADLQSHVERLSDELTRTEAKFADLEPNESSQKDDNRLLTLQLAQSREELEIYFKKYQDTKNELKAATEAAELRTDQIESPANRRDFTTEQVTPAFKLDLRNYFDGKGWHNSEPQGRWAGADGVSTILVPDLSNQSYNIKIRIVDTMSSEHLNGIKIMLNGRALESKVIKFSDIAGRLAPLRRWRAISLNKTKPVPAEVIAVVPKDALNSEGQQNVISISSLPPVSPSEFGEADSRQLSICVESIDFEGRV